MSVSSNLLKGTFLLTFTNIVTRVMGFCYRIFTSRIFTAEEIGLFQLAMPVFTLGYSLSVAGLQTVLSQTTAKYITKKQKNLADTGVCAAIVFALSLSAFYIYIVTINLGIISDLLFGTTSYARLVLCVAYTLPLSAFHGIVSGYYLGQRKTSFIAISQLIEQMSRIAFVIIFYQISIIKETRYPILFLAIGLITGELSACIFLLFVSRREIIPSFCKFVVSPSHFTKHLSLLKNAFPLTASRLFLNLLQSAESISIPIRLQASGLTASEAIAVYGTFSGMALPCILFPSAFTNALASMLLPTIASLQTKTSKKSLSKYIQAISICCFFMGFLCFLFYRFLGTKIGTAIFASPSAGFYISMLSFICPFLYTNTIFTSILNALGATYSTFFINSATILFRIVSVICLIPHFGITGYIIGLFTSQLTTSILSVLKIYFLLAD